MNFKVNSLTSDKTALPVEYYKLPFCQPPRIRSSAENLGEVLRGDRIFNSLYQMQTKLDETCKVVCRGAPLRPEANVTAGDFFSSISASASVLASRAAAASLRPPALSKCANAFSSRKYARRLQCDPPPATETSSLSLTCAERKRVPGPGSRVGRRSERFRTLTSNEVEKRSNRGRARLTRKSAMCARLTPSGAKTARASLGETFATRKLRDASTSTTRSACGSSG